LRFDETSRVFEISVRELAEDEGFRLRFVRESKAAASIDQYLQSGEWDEAPN